MGCGDDRHMTSAPPLAETPPSTASSSGNTRPYSGRGANSTSISTSPSVHVDLPQQEMGRAVAEVMPPVVFAGGQRVDHHGDPGLGAVRRLQHHGGAQVATGDLDRAGDPDRPVAGRFTQQSTEDRRAVEARPAQPVDGTVAADQRGAVAVGQQGVLADRSGAQRRGPPIDQRVARGAIPSTLSRPDADGR